MAYVYKNTDVEALDSYFSVDLGTAYAEALRLLRENPTSLVGTTTQLTELGGDLADVAANAGAFEENWLGLPNVERLMRAGYEKAIELANVRPRKPIETFWITNSSDDFEMHVTATDTKVTAFVVVPRANPFNRASRRAKSESWAIRLVGEEVSVRLVSGPGSEEDSGVE
jgi:hypothetical protein